MKRLLAVLACLVLAGSAASAQAQPAHRATPVNGRIVSSVTGLGVGGLTVKLHASTPSGPGGVIATATTTSNGSFQLSAGSGSGRIYVQLVAGRYQGGYVGDVPRYIQQTVAGADSYGPHANLGRIYANPAFITGTVVSSADGHPLAGVAMTARSATDLSQVEAYDVTDATGHFTVSPITCEDDCYLRLNGSSLSFETGYLACNFTVVATFDEACASPLGQLDHQIRLDPR